MAKPRDSLIEKLDEELVCSICYEEYNTPKTLPCIHSFCLECINKLHKNNCSVCPICRKRFFISNTADLPTAISINTLMDIKQAAVLEEQQHNNNEEKCPLHDEALKIFCVQCQEIVCLECLTDGHKEHEYKKILECYEANKMEIDQKMAATRQKIVDLEKLDRELYTVQDDLMCNRDIIIIDIKTRSGQLIDKINTLKKELIERVDREMDKKSDQLKTISNTTRTNITNLQNVVHEIEEKMKNWSKMKIVLSKKKLVDTVKQANNTTIVRYGNIHSLSRLNIAFRPLPIKDETMKFGQISKKRINCNRMCLMMTIVACIIAIIVSYYYPQYFNM